MAEMVILIHLLATLFMTGVIWFVQIVHYPLFVYVRADDFNHYHHQHMRRTSWVVGPMMTIEAISAVLLLVLPVFFNIKTLAVAGIVLLAAIWILTAGVQVPQHSALSTLENGDQNGTLCSGLVSGNWPRTVLWTMRSLIAMFLVLSLSELV